jgi:hypothetical protein
MCSVLELKKKTTLKLYILSAITFPCYIFLNMYVPRELMWNILLIFFTILNPQPPKSGRKLIRTRKISIRGPVI